MTLDELNGAPDEEARTALLACCGSRNWVAGMLARRPLRAAETLHAEAETIWRSLSHSDWLEAFAAHPRIGERSASKWSSQEQSGVADGSHETLRALDHLNAQYELHFGYTFIVCATGKSGAEMRGLLEQRLSNEPPTELQIAAAEQAKIMHLRLDKLLAE